MFGRETKKERLRRMELEYELKLQHQAAIDAAITETVKSVVPSLMWMLSQAIGCGGEEEAIATEEQKEA